MRTAGDVMCKKPPLAPVSTLFHLPDIKNESFVDFLRVWNLGRPCLGREMALSMT